jgi:phenylacetate-CoA ligase
MMTGWYEAAFRHALYPAYETGLRGRRTLAHFADYRRDQWLAPEQIAALQWERLKRLLEHCHREVPYYRRRWRELGITPADIGNLDDYAQLPVLTKADIRAHAEELKADSWRDRLMYKATGGSTGEPMRFGFTRESNDRRTAVMWRG